MIPVPEDRRPPMTPQLALRVAVVGSFALAMFAIIFFRLWFLQVLSGDQYLHAATVNRVRRIPVAAQRGEILDRSGHILVDSRQALAVQISPPDLPKSAAAQRRLYRRLAPVLGMSTRRVTCKVLVPQPSGPPRLVAERLARIPCDVAQQLAITSYANVTLKTDVHPQVQFYLAERQNQFPAVIVRKIYVRNYPRGGVAAQLIGTVGPINAQEFGQPGYLGIPRTAIIGQSGLEAAYDHFLRGSDGAETVSVDSLGQPTGRHSVTPPVAGHNLALSLDEKLQTVGEQALAQSVASNYPATGGAFVAMNPQDGSIYAMGSWPTYNPGIFNNNLSQAAYDRLISKSAGEPLLNRATNSAGPTGSTFKPITAAAALQSGAWTVGSSYTDTGSFCTSPGVCRFNAGHATYGTLDLRNAIRVSSDVFFYHLGALTNVADPLAKPQGGPLQTWSRSFGIGRKTGMDVPGELAGTLPSPAWR
ncbi:MAG: penicillin-binding transpeptidase domain-containing protein, partial [Solirubrobacteraceae bacterium]